MLVDLDSLRPKNETYEHFMLKQVARAWLFKKGMRYIACEVGIQGIDVSPYGQKKIADVVGVERKRKLNPAMQKLQVSIHNKAIAYGKLIGLTTEGFRGEHTWKNQFKLQGEEKAALENSITLCYENACENLGLHKETYKKVRIPYKEQYTLNLVEAKASLSDFRAGFCVSAEHSYIIAPKGIIPKEEIPAKVGLLEFDFEKFHETKLWEDALQVTKRPKKQYDSSFYLDPENKKWLDEEKHAQFCQELVFSIAQESTEELVFWNSFLRHVSDGTSHSPEFAYKFKFKAGDVTPLGIVIDRRMGKKTAEDIAAESKYLFTGSFTEFYKLVVPNEGITKWISSRLIEETVKNELLLTNT